MKPKQSKRKHPNQKLIDYFDLQAERELALATQFSKNRRYQNSANAITRRDVWRSCAQITKDLA